VIGWRHMILPAFSLDATGRQIGSHRRRVSRSTRQRRGDRTATKERDRATTEDCDKAVFGGPATLAFPFSESEAAHWQAIAIVGNSLVAACPRLNSCPAKVRQSVSFRA
jgi:hypothetical protein